MAKQDVDRVFDGVAARFTTELEGLADFTMQMRVVAFEHGDEDRQRGDGVLVPLGVRVGEIAYSEQRYNPQDEVVVWKCGL